MPKIGYKQTLEHRIKIKVNHAKPWFGKKRLISEETRKKMSEIAKKNNRIPPSNKGKKFSVETRNKMRKRMLKNNPFKGKKHSEETRKKMSEVKIGKKISQETKIKMSKTRKKYLFRHPELKQRLSKALKGNKSHFWKGGKSFELYGFEWTNLLKHSIRTRDCFICQICNKNGWIVHHIDYDKKNNNPNNLITLCRSCHSKTNYNRNHWIKYFKRLKWKV